MPAMLWLDRPCFLIALNMLPLVPTSQNAWLTNHTLTWFTQYLKQKSKESYNDLVKTVKSVGICVDVSHYIFIWLSNLVADIKDEDRKLILPVYTLWYHLVTLVLHTRPNSLVVQCKLQFLIRPFCLEENFNKFIVIIFQFHKPCIPPFIIFYK